MTWIPLANLRGPGGEPGAAATISVGTVSTGTPGSSASVTNTGTPSAAVLDITIPRGSAGAPGSPGAAATVAVGTVTTGAPGSSATVVNVGTAAAAVLDFTIPAGESGTGGGGMSLPPGMEFDEEAHAIRWTPVPEEGVPTVPFSLELSPSGLAAHDGEGAQVHLSGGSLVLVNPEAGGETTHTAFLRPPTVGDFDGFLPDENNVTLASREWVAANGGVPDEFTLSEGGVAFTNGNGTFSLYPGAVYTQSTAEGSVILTPGQVQLIDVSGEIPAQVMLRAPSDGTKLFVGRLPNEGTDPAPVTLASREWTTAGLAGKASASHTHTAAEVGAAAASHTHAAGDIGSGTFAIARIPTGTSGTTVALGNHTHTAASVGAAAASHAHSAADVNSGVLDIARVPTGTSGTTVALGNHTHTAASVGAAASVHTHAAADVTESATRVFVTPEQRTKIDGSVTSTDVTSIVMLTMTEYDALPEKVEGVWYIIEEAPPA